MERIEPSAPRGPLVIDCDQADIAGESRLPILRPRVEYLHECRKIRLPGKRSGDWEYIDPVSIKSVADWLSLSRAVHRPSWYDAKGFNIDLVESFDEALLHAFGCRGAGEWVTKADGSLAYRCILNDLAAGEFLDWPAILVAPSVASPWADLPQVDELDASVLIGPGRWLTRGSGLMLIAPTGAGKSTWSATQCFAWAIGRESLGLRPNGEIKSLVFQSEDDPADLAAMGQGIIQELRPTPEEADMIRKNVLVVTERKQIGLDFLKLAVRPQLVEHRPDLLVINPLSAFAGCDLNSQEEVARFLRTGLSALLEEFSCACLLVHHIPKPSKDRQEGFRAYSGAGSADLANWAREVVTLEPAGSSAGMFRMAAAKRWRHLGWTDGDGKPTDSRLICYGVNGQYWREPSTTDMQQAGARQYSSMALVALVPQCGIDKADLMEQVQTEFAVSPRTASQYIKDLTRLKVHVIDGQRVRCSLLTEVKRDRSEVYPGQTGRKVVWVTRSDQSEGLSTDPSLPETDLPHNEV